MTDPTHKQGDALSRAIDISDKEARQAFNAFLNEPVDFDMAGSPIRRGTTMDAGWMLHCIELGWFAAWNRRAGQQGEARPARDLPPLPIPWKQVPDADGVLVDVFRTFQMRDFGRAALATQAAPEAQSEQGERDTLRALLREARTLHLPIALASWNEEPQYAHRVEEVLTLIARIDAALADGGAK